jgi:predicted DNA-binding transcriptional regulator AlpA
MESRAMSEEEFADITLLKLKTVAAAIGVSADTINGWCKRGLFPRPLQCRSGAPKMWKYTTIKAWIAKRERAHYQKPTPRGRLKRGIAS